MIKMIFMIKIKFNKIWVFTINFKIIIVNLVIQIDIIMKY